MDESFLLTASGKDSEELFRELLFVAKQRKLHVLVNSRLVASEDERRELNFSEYLEELVLLVCDELRIDEFTSIRLDPFTKDRLKDWLDSDFQRRKKTHRLQLALPLDTSIVKRARNNLLHSCYNPLFAHIFSDRFYEEDDSFDDIYGIYETFVDKTIGGKFAKERRSGNRAIKEIQREYRTIVQEMAVSIASIYEFQFYTEDLHEWRVDHNRKRYVLPHEKVHQIITELTEKWVDPHILERLQSDHLGRNILACYFFEEGSEGWRFRDNNIIFFLLAEVLMDDLLSRQFREAPDAPLTTRLPRFSRPDRVPLHPVAVRMWLSKLRRLSDQRKLELREDLLAAYNEGRFLSNVTRVDDTSKEVRLQLYLSLAFIHINTDYHRQDFFFEELERLMKQLFRVDPRAFDVFRASLRYAKITNTSWSGQNLNGFNFSDCYFVDLTFDRCEMKDVIANDLVADNVSVELCRPCELKGTGLKGKLSFNDCPNVVVDVTLTEDLSLTFKNCRHIVLKLKQNRGLTKKPKLELTFSGCDNITKTSLRGLKRSKTSCFRQQLSYFRCSFGTSQLPNRRRGKVRFNKSLERR